MGWLDFLAVQGTLKNLLQHHSSNPSILWCSAFFIVQLSHPYMTTGKTIALTRWTFVDKVMSLLYNMLSRLVITFLPRRKRLLISWLQSPSAVNSLQYVQKKIKGDHKGFECLQILKRNKALLRRISRPSAPGFSSHQGTQERKAGKSQVPSPRLMWAEPPTPVWIAPKSLWLLERSMKPLSLLCWLFTELESTFRL